MNLISFESNIAAWTRGMDDLVLKQVPFATAKALTDTVKQLKAHHQEIMPMIFDRPTRFTINSLQAKPASKSKLIASVEPKDSSRAASHYLLPQIEGGGRPHKRFEQWLINRGLMKADEYAMPARGVKLNAYGNISQGTVVQILSQLGASPDAHQWETARSRKRAASRRARYFVPRAGLPRGVWRRRGKAIEPVLIFAKAPAYQTRYRFNEISSAFAEARFPRNFQNALVHAIATAR